MMKYMGICNALVRLLCVLGNTTLNLYEDKRDKPKDALTSNNLQGMDIVLGNELFLVDKLTSGNDLMMRKLVPETCHRIFSPGHKPQ